MDISEPASIVLTKKAPRSRSSRLRAGETEEETIIRRFQDAQRMARFRARKKKALEDLQRRITNEIARGSAGESAEPERLQCLSPAESQPDELSADQSKYSQLLAIIERLGQDVRLSYAGSRSSVERLKSGIGRARTLVRDCLIETRLNLR